MNLAFRYPIIFWNCACLITNSGGSEDDEDEEEIVDIYEPEDFDEYEYVDAPDRKTKKKKKRSNKYDKIATAIGKMRSEGINIVPPDINTSRYTFYPDVENNKILFGLRGLINVGDDIINDIIANRSYTSVKDFIKKIRPKKPAMISLIKAGAFDNFEDRKFLMAWYVWTTCDKKQQLTLQNMTALLKNNLLPDESEDMILAKRVYEFNRYLKACCKINAEYYLIDERALNFLCELEKEDLIIEGKLLEVKVWDKKVYQLQMNTIRNYIKEHKEEMLKELNFKIFEQDWNKYASGTISAWEMQSLCFYYHEHELINVDKNKYGFVNFFNLPEEPEIDRVFYKGNKEIKMFKLHRICGTCIAKNKDKGMATLLTPYGVVPVKFRKEYFSMFDKQISQPNGDGTKSVIEKSWFARGSKIIVTGMRSGDSFVAKKYQSTGGHTLYKIEQVLENGDLILKDEREQVNV